MIVSGVVLWIIGISLTPNLIDITSIQYVPDIATDTFSNCAVLQEDFAIRTSMGLPVC